MTTGIHFSVKFQYTQSEANRLGLRGWCMNTRQDTVKGVMQGPTAKVDEM